MSKYCVRGMLIGGGGAGGGTFGAGTNVVDPSLIKVLVVGNVGSM